MNNLTVINEVEVWTEQLAAFAIEMKMDVDLPVEALITNSSTAIVTARKLEVGAGISLLAAKSKCGQGEFLPFLKNGGINERRARELMDVARLLSKTPAAQRTEMLHQPKTVLIGMARMDDEVLAAALEDGAFKERLTIQEFEYELKRLRAENEGLLRQFDAKDARKKLNDGRIVSPDVPYQAMDVRRELAALHEKAALEINSLGDMVVAINELAGMSDCAEWAQPTAQQAYTQLRSLIALAAVAAQRFEASYDMAQDMPSAASKVYLRPMEAEQVALHGEVLRTKHLDEKSLRDKQRKNERADATGAKGRRFDLGAGEAKAKK